MSVSEDTSSIERNGIVSAGTWVLDRVKLVDLWPEEEHLALITANEKQGGGSGHNLAVDIRRLDSSIPVEAIGLIGDDADGAFLLEHATHAEIDTTQLHCTTVEQTSFTDVITDSRTGKRTFFHYPGTNDLLSPEHFDFSLCKARWLHLGLLGVHKVMDSEWEHFDNGWVAVLEAAREHGIKANLELVSIAAERIQSIALPCLPYLDSLIINEYELSALSGLSVSNADGEIDSDKCIAAAQSLFAKGSMSVVVVHYPRAAIAVTLDGDCITQASFDVHPSWINSSVGAGDAFAAGVLYGLHEQWSLDASIELGHAAAAASLRAATTVGSVEDVNACLAFARQAHTEKRE